MPSSSGFYERKVKLTMVPRFNLPVEELDTVFLLDSSTGNLWWRVSGRGRLTNKPVGGTGLNGYKTVRYKGKSYLQHHIVWAMTNGRWPDREIDHANGQRDDNTPSNLREASRVENARNSKLSTNNTSGYKGVWWCNRKKKWVAEIGLHGKNKKLGYFTDIEQANTVRTKAEQVLFQEFRREA